MHSEAKSLPLKAAHRRADRLAMEFLGAALSSVASMLFLTMVVAGVYKLFQVATLLSEMKDLLLDIKRNTNSQPLATPPSTPFSGPITLESAENLLRAVSELDHLTPPVIEHKS